MDELEFLKQNWKKQEENLPSLSYDEIYKMIWKKSSSIVKWIFVISIIELLLSTLLTVFMADANYWDQMEEIHLKQATIFVYIISYLITFYFIYCFYRNYRRISSTDDAATLMHNILKTRRTVRTYIAYVLISTGIYSVVVAYFTIQNHQLVQQVEDTSKYTFDAMDWIKFTVAGCIILAIFLLALWMFYRLIYGIFLRRLKRNYRELKKLEM
ncbi:membrane protein [Salinimicrobium terrae]|uniref:membrane protein n=1 Tax=Salinimicrobium terrae TaxID=470866 RepID=UPI000407E177|nr:membrane protein [Salinimicrobium terrae]